MAPSRDVPGPAEYNNSLSIYDFITGSLHDRLPRSESRVASLRQWRLKGRRYFPRCPINLSINTDLFHCYWKEQQRVATATAAVASHPPSPAGGQPGGWPPAVHAEPYTRQRTVEAQRNTGRELWRHRIDRTMETLRNRQNPGGRGT